MSRGVRFSLLWLLGLGTALALAGCSSSKPSKSPEELARNTRLAVDFKEYTPLWLGESFRGEKLDNIVAPLNNDTSWTFSYGECEALHDENNGCTYQLEVQNESICRSWPERIDGPPGTWRFRGAQAAWSGSLTQLDVFTGMTDVHVYAGSKKEALMRAKALRPAGRTLPVKRLKPPVKGGLTGELPCQQKLARHPWNLDSEAQKERAARQRSK